MFPSLVIFHPDLYESLISTLLNQVFFFFNTSHIFSSKYLPEFLLSNFKSFIPSSNFISCYNNYTISCDSILKKNLKFLPRFFPSNVSQYHPLQKIIINWNKKRKFDNPFEMSGHILLDIFHKLKNKVTPIIFVDKSPPLPKSFSTNRAPSFRVTKTRPSNIHRNFQTRPARRAGSIHGSGFTFWKCNAESFVVSFRPGAHF